MDQATVLAIVQAAAAVGAMAAAVFSYFSVHNARQSHYSAVYLDMAARYDSQEMRDAFNDLLDWRKRYGADFANEWLARKRERMDDAMKANTARRIVARYFLNIARLLEIEAIDRKAAKQLAACYGLNVFYQIAVPLNRLIAEDTADFERLTRRLKGIRKSYANGELIDSF
jgi:hypothetical protein